MVYDEIICSLHYKPIFHIFGVIFLRNICIFSIEKGSSKELLILSLNKKEKVHFKERGYITYMFLKLLWYYGQFTTTKQNWYPEFWCIVATVVLLWIVFLFFRIALSICDVKNAFFMLCKSIWICQMKWNKPFHL